MCKKFEYYFPIDPSQFGAKVKFPEFPHLDIYYVSVINDSAGINLKVNDENVTIGIGSEEILGNYKFSGLRLDQNNFVISVEKCWVYNIGQPFIVEFPDNPSTGYTWSINLSPGLELIQSTHSTNCRQGTIGCGGVRTFVLQGISPGKQLLTATHEKSWDPTTRSTHIYKFDIIQ